MGRAPCTEKSGLKKGLWSPEEDEKLYTYILKHGHGNWSTLPKNAGLARAGKSCRLRWTNYLRPDIKRGAFSFQEELLIVELHRILGNRWSMIAERLPGRTDNEIKNYWNTQIRKRRLLRTDTHNHNLQGGSSSSYLELEVQETSGSIVSSSSGTIVSTAYTSSVSRPSTTISMETTMHFVSMEIDGDVNGNRVQVCEEAEDEEAEDEETEEEHIRSLVQEFFSAPSANCSIIKVGDMSVVERWLKELGVGWVLRLHDDGASAAAGEEEESVSSFPATRAQESTSTSIGVGGRPTSKRPKKANPRFTGGSWV